MHPDSLDALKTHFGFHNWKRAGARGQQVFVRNFRVSGDELPYQLIKSRSARLRTARRVNTSTWDTTAVEPGIQPRRPAATPATVQPFVESQRPVVVDAFEYDSSDLARESLLELTTQFHQPVPLDVQLEEIGDVSVATRDGAWFAFTRGNLLVRVMSSSGAPMDMRSVAEHLDASLLGKPERRGPPPETEAEAVFAAAPFGTDAVPLSIPLETDSPETPPDELPYVKVLARGGTVEFSDGLVFKPEAPDVKVEVFVMQPGGQTSEVRYEGPAPQTPKSRNEQTEH
jgi:hypothetical protein